MNIKRILPKTFFGRSLAIIIIPMLILQSVLTYFFYERHWEDVGRRLVLGLGGQIAFIISEIENNNKPYKNLFRLAEENFLIKSSIDPGKSLKNYQQHQVRSLLDKTLFYSLKERLSKPYKFDTKSIKNRVQIFVEIKEGVITFEVPRKILHSSTIEVFIIWMISTSILLISLAFYFMRKQINPLNNIMKAAEELGKGNNNFKLFPKGSFELRLLAKVFIKMRERIKNQIKQRTLMLAGISHDLRTPLTRIKLQLAFIKDENISKKLSEDVLEMEKMLNEYLQFASSRSTEKTETFNISELIENTVKKYDKKNIKTHLNQRIYINGRKNLILRCLNNLIDNSIKYSQNIKIELKKTSNNIIIFIDDDGPGIKEKDYDNVFKPFFKLDKSRGDSKSSVGLGLSIASDVIKSHGGNITLNKSPMNGLRVTIFLPF